MTSRTALLLLLLACDRLFAHEAQGLTFDCWIGNSEGRYTTHFIRCIADRDLSPAGLAEVDARFDTLNDLIHRQLHFGGPGDAEKAWRANSKMLRVGDVWSIVLYSWPTDQSWAEHLPERLVRANLCPDDPQCQVIIYRH